MTKITTTACFIPVKSRSTRVPGKNLKLLNGKPLFEYIIDVARSSNSFDEIFVDTDNDDVKKYCEKVGVTAIERDPELAKDSANGNDLINDWYSKFSDFDYYFQLFATSPFTKKETIKSCVQILRENDREKKNDSIFTAHKKCGWYWYEGNPINYDPIVLPRSQDAKHVISETTALYGITLEALKNIKCRIGRNPYIYLVDDIESMDIDSEFDFKIAEIIASER